MFQFANCEVYSKGTKFLIESPLNTSVGNIQEAG